MTFNVFLLKIMKTQHDFQCVQTCSRPVQLVGLRSFLQSIAVLHLGQCLREEAGSRHTHSGGHEAVKTVVELALMTM